MQTEGNCRPAILAGCLVLGVVLVATLAGCGGGSSELAAPGPEPAVQSTPFCFVGDLVTGAVTALPPGDSLDAVSPQVVGLNTGVGSALLVTSTDLAIRPGNPGWRVVRMRVTNNSGVTVGALPHADAPSGIDLVFVSIAFKKANGTRVPGGSVADPDGYDPHAGTPIIRIPGPLVKGGTASREVGFQVPLGATQVLWSVYVRTDSAVAGTFPRLLSHCYVSTVAGSEPFGYVDGAADRARFLSPSGLCVQSSGSILVADRFNNALREVTQAGMVRTVSSLGTPLLEPTDVAVDEIHSTPSAQVVYVSCAVAERVYRVVRDPGSNVTASVTSVAGGGGSPTATMANNLDLGTPLGLACDRTGAFWVADAGNSRLYQIRPSPTANVLIAPANKYMVVLNLNNVGSPQDCAVADDGAVFIADGLSGTVFRRDPNSAITAIPYPGSPPSAVAVNRAGTICYVQDPVTDVIYQVRQLSANPMFSWIAEAMTAGGTGYRDGSGLVAQFKLGSPGLALDSAGTLYVADIDNDRIRRIDRIAGE